MDPAPFHDLIESPEAALVGGMAYPDDSFGEPLNLFLFTPDSGAMGALPSFRCTHFTD